jgi:6-phosphogluconate dehydrogenase (decarboxylating)
MCPDADDETLSLVLPILRKVAAQASDGIPCVGSVGTGGAGHYCKMIHNGIEYVQVCTYPSPDEKGVTANGNFRFLLMSLAGVRNIC